MAVKLIRWTVMLAAVSLGARQGYVLFSGHDEIALVAGGVGTVIAAVLMLFPKTFLWGNFLLTLSIVLVICYRLMDKDMRGLAIEVPLLLLNLVVLELQHPLKK